MTTTTAAVEFDLPFATPPDLDATMDIQIPALAWQPDSAGGYRRVLYLGGQPIVVTVCEGHGGLRVTASRHHDELPGPSRRRPTYPGRPHRDSGGGRPGRRCRAGRIPGGRGAHVRVIWVTGVSGAGKSAVSRRLAASGYDAVSTDSAPVPVPVGGRRRPAGRTAGRS